MADEEPIDADGASEAATYREGGPAWKSLVAGTFHPKRGLAFVATAGRNLELYSKTDDR
jgi:hypothetical protein